MAEKQKKNNWTSDSYNQKREVSTADTPGQPPKQKKPVAVPRPSSSIILISPQNSILLLHRVRTSSSFPSAHVFPGGNLSNYHEGHVPIPHIESPDRHRDGPAYRLGAIRETFEESGILLARDKNGRLLELPEKAREEARKQIHSGKVRFDQWVESQGGTPDTDALIPFTRWVTPTNVPKRFTTQMYIYFLPLEQSRTPGGSDGIPSAKEAVIPTPTSDGGLEHTAARFLSAAEWLRRSSKTEKDPIILFPPQYFLLSLIGRHLQYAPGPLSSTYSPTILEDQRTKLREFLQTSDPPWAEKCISPLFMLKRKLDGRSVLGLHQPGKELEGSGRRGEDKHVVLVRFNKEGPREVEVALKKEILEEERQGEAKL